MNKFLAAMALLFGVSVALADPSVFFTENFASYSDGDFLTQCEDANIYQAGNKSYFTYTIGSDEGGKMLSVTKVSGDGKNSGIWLATGVKDEYFTDTGIMSFRFDFNPVSNLGGFIIGNGSAGRTLWAYRNGGTVYVKVSDSKEFKIDGIGSATKRWEINISYPTRRVVNIIVDGQTNVPINFIAANVKATHIGPASLCQGFIASSGSYEGKMGNIEVAYESLTTPVPQVSTASVLIGRNQKTYDLNIANNGGGSFEYEISALGDPEWLSFSPSGTCVSAKSHRLTFNRNLMTNGFYRTIVTVNCGSYGSFEIPFNVRSGLVFYYENFEAPYMLPGELHGQQGWIGKVEDDGYNPGYNEALVNEPADAWDGQCLTIKKAGGYDGYNYPVWTPSNLIIKVSCKMKWDYVGEADRFEFKGTYWRNPAVFDLWYNKDGNDVRLWRYNDTDGYPLVGDYGLPGGTWQDFSYTLDFRMQRLTDFTFGDFVTNFTQKALRKKNNELVDPMWYYEKLTLHGGGEESIVNFSVDNILITEVERAKIAIPVYDNAVSIGGLNKATNVLQNAGAVNYKFAAKLLDSDLASNLTLSRTSGTIGTKGVVIYKLDRKGLSDGYYTARVQYDWEASNSTNSGSFVQLVTFGVGGWYYTTEFEGPLFHLGSIDGQECWKYESGYGDIDLVLEDGLQCLHFDQASRCSVKAGVPAESHFSFRCLVKFPDNNNTTYVKFCQIDNKGFLPIYLRRDRDTKEVVLYYYPSGEEDPAELYRASLLDEWVPFHYNLNLDMAFSGMSEIGLGEFSKTFYEGEAVLNPDYDGKAIDSFSIEAVNNGPEEERDTGVYIKNVVVCDHSIPEPALLGLLAIAALAATRKRG